MFKMMGKIIILIIMWMIYAASAISIIIMIALLLKILVWDNVKRLFKGNKSDKKVLKDLKKYKTFGDIKR